jgi:hypothetical protein
MDSAIPGLGLDIAKLLPRGDPGRWMLGMIGRITTETMVRHIANLNTIAGSFRTLQAETYPSRGQTIMAATKYITRGPRLSARTKELYQGVNPAPVERVKARK